ncbi:hypothetical protein D3C87_1250510 [compost metagenome]
MAACAEARKRRSERVAKRSSVQANVAFQIQRFFGVAEVGRRDFRRFQLAEWLETAIRFHAFM